MSWIRYVLKSIFNISNLIIVCVMITLLLIINFSYVYFSPSLVNVIPQDVIRHTSTCYRTIFHYRSSKLKEWQHNEIIFGDSFSEGSGDEFLNGDSDYGIFNKLEGVERNLLLFGRAGYGSIRTSLEEKRCMPLLSSYTKFNIERSDATHLTFVFYEGNDLNNNLRELKHASNEFLFSARFLLPIFDYLSAILVRSVWLVKSFTLIEKEDAFAGVSNRDFPTSTSGVRLIGYPQSAAAELSESELHSALGALEETLVAISSRYMNVEKQFLYLPAVASSYQFKDELRVQSYNGKVFYLTSGENNRLRSDILRARVKLISKRSGWDFCDTTDTIVGITSTGNAVHGPRDWKHFNKLGYTAVKNVYQQCFLNN